MQRRAFLKFVGAGALVTSPFAVSCAGKRREEVLAAIAHEVVFPSVKEAVELTKRLKVAIAGLVSYPLPPQLAQVRDAWEKTLLSWTQALCLRVGPLLDSHAARRLMTWPIASAAMDEILRDQKALDKPFFAQLEPNKKGLFGIEHLLFPSEDSDVVVAASFEGQGGDRHRRFLGGVTRDLFEYADSVAVAFADGNAFSDAFAKAGQDSVNRMVNQMANAIDTTAKRLGAALGASKEPGKPGELEGGPGMVSGALASVRIEGTAHLYRGMGNGGLGDLVRAESRSVHEKVDAAFGAAVDAAKKLGNAIEQTVQKDRSAVEAASNATKGLAAALQTDVAKALNVTLQVGDEA